MPCDIRHPPFWPQCKTFNHLDFLSPPLLCFCLSFFSVDSNRLVSFYFLAVYLNSSRHFCSLFSGLSFFGDILFGHLPLVSPFPAVCSSLSVVSFLGSVVCCCIIFLHIFCHLSYAAPVLVNNEKGGCRENSVALDLCSS